MDNFLYLLSAIAYSFQQVAKSWNIKIPIHFLENAVQILQTVIQFHPQPQEKPETTEK